MLVYLVEKIYDFDYGYRKRGLYALLSQYKIKELFYMSKKKTDAEMIRELIEQYITTYPEAAEEIEEIIEELDPCVNCEVHYCNDCSHWHDNEEEDEDWDEEDCCELDDEDGDCEGHEICGCNDEDCYSCKGTEEHKQIEDLSKFITSVGTILGGDMGLLVFDKSNKKDMEKLAAIFKDYTEKL